MSRARAVILAALVVVFIVAGGVLIYANTHQGRQSRTFDVIVTKGESMTPSDLKAHQNDRITINVTSDQDGEVHVHEYDIAIEAKAGQTVSHSFTADKTCSCDIEWEASSHQLGTLTVSP